MPAAPDATAEHIKDVNTRYHDVAADSYDSKWGIDFGDLGGGQVIAKLGKALGPANGPLETTGPSPRFADALEIGSGTGYFSLNLVRSGVIGRATCTDISPGMLAALQANAERLGLEVSTVRTEAESLPFADDSFDLVFGHAVLHHIPDLDRAAREFRRVLRPGGVLAFCGEPSAHGDRLAALPKRAALLVAPLWRRLMRAPKVSGWGEGSRIGEHAASHMLEGEVDVHAFDPGLLTGFLERAGFDSVHIRGEELVANFYGWGLRTLESTAEPDSVPVAWRKFAFYSYMALQRIDSTVLEPNLPPALFYNLVLSARNPG
jgi:SAM-dependent methyltransferase